MPALQRITPGTNRELFRLIEGVTTIGRADNNFVRLNYLDVSRKHAVIECTENRCVISNLSLSSQTHVNNRKVAGHQRLVHGDVIRIGSVEMIFLESDNVDDMSDDAVLPDRLTVAPPLEEDPDHSVRRKLSKSGEIQLPAETGPGGISQHKVVYRVRLDADPTASVLMNDATSKLSCLLRLVEDLKSFQEEEDNRVLCESIYREFPGCDQIVITRSSSCTSPIQVLLTDARHKSNSAVTCFQVISHSMQEAEAVLLYDLWKDAPQSRPGLTNMDRLSIMVAPIRTADGRCLGAVQLLSAPSQDRFTERDLEKLSLAAKLLCLIIDDLGAQFDANTEDRLLLDDSRERA